MWRYFARVFRAKYLYYKSLWYFSLVYRTPPTSPLLSGATKKFTTLQEKRLVLTKETKFPLIGRRTSQRFVLEWGTAQKQDSWSFSKVPTHWMHLSLIEHTGLFHWENKWKSLIGPQASVQTNCNKERFNFVGTTKSQSKARIGIIVNQQNNCST